MRTLVLYLVGNFSSPLGEQVAIVELPYKDSYTNSLVLFSKNLVSNISNFATICNIFHYISQCGAAKSSLKQRAYKNLSHCLFLSGDTVAIVRTKCFGKLMI